MNAVMRAPTMAQIDEFDLEYLRNQIRSCLRARMPSMGSTLADRHAPRRRTKTEQPLSKPSSTYTVEELQKDGSYKDVEKRKPAHAQWPTTTHATATRPPGFSREAMDHKDFGKAKYARAIYSLSSLHITSIRARYAPGKTTRMDHRQKLAKVVAARYNDPQVQGRAKDIAMVVLSGQVTPKFCCALFGMTPDEWRKSSHRKMLSDIKARLAMIDAESLLAWERACMVEARSNSG